jgi:hypothetical protein
MITDDNRVFITTPKFEAYTSAKAGSIFDKYGYYCLRIGISYRGGKTTFHNILFLWTGHKATMKMSSLDSIDGGLTFAPPPMLPSAADPASISL